MEVITNVSRPIISKYSKVADYISDQILFLKKSDKTFSVLNACKKFRRVSPALVSLIIKGKRKVTLDRVDELARLLQMTVAEKFFMRDWIERSELNISSVEKATYQVEPSQRVRRKEVAINILNDWLNVYVKDCFQLKTLQENPKLIYSHLAHIADPKRIDKSLQFLLKEGYLRKTLDQRIVIETQLAVVESPVPSQKIRQFHKAALAIAKNGIDTVSMDKRYINTFVLPLTEKKYTDFVEIIEEFTQRLQQFTAELNIEDADSLYQFNLNLVPTGRKEI